MELHMSKALFIILPSTILLYYLVSKAVNAFVKSKIKSTIISLITVYIIGVFFIYSVSLLHSAYSRHSFMKSATGELALNLTPLKINVIIEKDKAYSKSYCGQFSNKSGELINTATIMDDGNAYCGMFPPHTRFNPKQVIPYKLLSKTKALYWISPTTQIIGPAPHNNK